MVVVFFLTVWKILYQLVILVMWTVTAVAFSCVFSIWWLSVAQFFACCLSSVSCHFDHCLFQAWWYRIDWCPKLSFHWFCLLLWQSNITIFFMYPFVICSQILQQYNSDHVTYTSTNKTKIIWLETKLLFFFFFFLPSVDASHVYVGARLLPQSY